VFHQVQAVLTPLHPFPMFDSLRSFHWPLARSARFSAEAQLCVSFLTQVTRRDFLVLKLSWQSLSYPEDSRKPFFHFKLSPAPLSDPILSFQVLPLSPQARHSEILDRSHPLPAKMLVSTMPFPVFPLTLLIQRLVPHFLLFWNPVMI